MARTSRAAGPLFIAGAVIILTIGACGEARPLATSPGTVASPTPGGTSPAAPTPTTPPVTAGPSTPPRNPAAYVEGVAYAPAFDPETFVDGIDHPFFPMVVGATFVFDGDEHVEVEVVDENKDILGIAATVVRDRVFEDCVLIEDTRDWYGQDGAGNVWYLGEETAEYEDGEITSTAGSWEAGVDGALPGIVMLAEPQAGDSYHQEFYAGEAEDIGEVTAVTGSVSVPAGGWSGSDVLVTEEWTPLEPDVRERKIYARGVGVIRIRAIQGGSEVTTLTSAELPGDTFGEPGVLCARA